MWLFRDIPGLTIIYTNRFGPLPRDCIKFCANTGLHRELDERLVQAIADGVAIEDWGFLFDAYQKRLPAPAAPPASVEASHVQPKRPSVATRAADYFPATEERLDPSKPVPVGLPPGMLCGGPRASYLVAPASLDWELATTSSEPVFQHHQRELPGLDDGRMFQGGIGPLTWDGRADLDG